MSTLRSKMIRLAASMPKGSEERTALLKVLAGDIETEIVKELQRRGHSVRAIREVLHSQGHRITRMHSRGGIGASDIADVLETYEPLSYR